MLHLIELRLRYAAGCDHLPDQRIRVLPLHLLHKRLELLRHIGLRPLVERIIERVRHSVRPPLQALCVRAVLAWSTD